MLLGIEDYLDFWTRSRVLETRHPGILDSGMMYHGSVLIGRQFAFQAIASHLIAHEEGQVALVATTDPSLARLRDILIARLSRNDRGPVLEESGYVYQKQHSAVISTQDIMIQVTSMLERVRISRVFDFPGVAEALSEFSVSFKGEGKANEEKADESEHDRVRSIADSEDDLVADLETQRPGTASTTKDEDSGVKILPASMFVVDNIANVVGSTMAKSQVQGIAFVAVLPQAADAAAHTYQATHS